MSVLIGALFIGSVFFVVWSFTGGFAAAIAARGREDRSLLANAGIGFVGWLTAAILWAIFVGEWPDEFSFGLAFLALGCSVAYLLISRRLSEREQAASSEESQQVG